MIYRLAACVVLASVSLAQVYVQKVHDDRFRVIMPRLGTSKTWQVHEWYRARVPGTNLYMGTTVENVNASWMPGAVHLTHYVDWSQCYAFGATDSATAVFSGWTESTPANWSTGTSGYDDHIIAGKSASVRRSNTTSSTAETAYIDITVPAGLGECTLLLSSRAGSTSINSTRRMRLTNTTTGTDVMLDGRGSWPQTFLCGGASGSAGLTLTPGGTIEVGDIFTVTITDPSGEANAFSYAATGTTVASVTAGFAAAWNASSSALFSQFTATDNTTTVTLSLDAPNGAMGPYTHAATTTEAGGGAADAQTFVLSGSYGSSEGRVRGVRHWDAGGLADITVGSTANTHTWELSRSLVGGNTYRLRVSRETASTVEMNYGRLILIPPGAWSTPAAGRAYFEEFDLLSGSTFDYGAYNLATTNPDIPLQYPTSIADYSGGYQHGGIYQTAFSVAGDQDAIVISGVGEIAPGEIVGPFTTATVARTDDIRAMRDQTGGSASSVQAHRGIVDGTGAVGTGGTVLTVTGADLSGFVAPTSGTNGMLLYLTGQTATGLGGGRFWPVASVDDGADTITLQGGFAFDAVAPSVAWALGFEQAALAVCTSTYSAGWRNDAYALTHPRTQTINRQYAGTISANRVQAPGSSARPNHSNVVGTNNVYLATGVRLFRSTAAPSRYSQYELRHGMGMEDFRPSGYAVMFSTVEGASEYPEVSRMYYCEPVGVSGWNNTNLATNTLGGFISSGGASGGKFYYVPLDSYAATAGTTSTFEFRYAMLPTDYFDAGGARRRARWRP